MKLAYSDVHANVADPRVHDTPVAQLLSKEYARKRAARDRSEPRELRSEGRRSDRQQYDLSDRRRQRRQHRQLDSEPLFCLRFAGHGGRDGIRAAKSRRELHSRSETSERAGGRQAAISHHHSGLHGEGRRAHRLRNHGRRGAADGSRAVRFQLRRLRDEPAGSAGSAAFLQEQRARAAMSTSNRACPQRRCSNCPSAATRSESGANTWRPWAAARRFCTTRKPG